MQPVVAAPMNGAEVARVVCPAASLLDHVVGSVRAVQAAVVAEASVAFDDREGELAPCLLAVLSVYGVGAKPEVPALGTLRALLPTRHDGAAAAEARRCDGQCEETPCVSPPNPSAIGYPERR